ncbi:MAG: hypothetical protein WEB67_01955 [Acidimicrobiia bacterium]
MIKTPADSGRGLTGSLGAGASVVVVVSGIVELGVGFTTPKSLEMGGVVIAKEQETRVNMAKPPANHWRPLNMELTHSR